MFGGIGYAVGGIVGIIKPLIYLAIPSILTIAIGVAWTVASNYGAAQAAIQRSVEVNKKNQIIAHITEKSLIGDSDDFKDTLKSLRDARLLDDQRKSRIRAAIPKESASKEPVSCPINCSLPQEFFSSD